MRLSLALLSQVLVRPSDSVTHIIFKAGKSSTLAHYRKFVPAGPTPLAGEEMMALEDLVDLDGLGEESGPSPSGRAPIHLVGIGWVIRESRDLLFEGAGTELIVSSAPRTGCKEEKKRVSEFEYKIDVAEQSNFQKVCFSVLNILSQRTQLTLPHLDLLVPAEEEIDVGESRAALPLSFTTSCSPLLPLCFFSQPKQMRAMLEAPVGNSMAASVEKARRRSLLFARSSLSPLTPPRSLSH